MSKNIKIGWIPWPWEKEEDKQNLRGLELLLENEPEKITSTLKDAGTLKRCPAHTNFLNEFFLMRAPSDLYFTLNEDGTLDTNIINQSVWEDLIFLRFHQMGKDNKKWVTIVWRYIFVADEDCDLEIYPAFGHESPYEVAVGAFNIHKWQRPIDFTFALEGNSVNIKKGDPLYYIRFKTPTNTNKSVEFVRLKGEQEKELAENVHRCVNFKRYSPNKSWNLIKTIGNKLRPKKFIK